MLNLQKLVVRFSIRLATLEVTYYEHIQSIQRTF